MPNVMYINVQILNKSTLLTLLTFLLKRVIKKKMKVKKIGEIRVFNFDSCHKKKKKKMIHLEYMFLNIEDGLCMNYSLIIIDSVYCYLSKVRVIWRISSYLTNKVILRYIGNLLINL